MRTILRDLWLQEDLLRGLGVGRVGKCKIAFLCDASRAPRPKRDSELNQKRSVTPHYRNYMPEEAEEPKVRKKWRRQSPGGRSNSGSLLQPETSHIPVKGTTFPFKSLQNSESPCTAWTKKRKKRKNSSRSSQTLSNRKCRSSSQPIITTKS